MARVAIFAMLLAGGAGTLRAQQLESIYDRATLAFQVRNIADIKGGRDNALRVLQAGNLPGGVAELIVTFLYAPLRTSGDTVATPTTQQLTDAGRLLAQSAGPAMAAIEKTVNLPLPGIAFQATLVQGIALFLAERAKEELTYAFLDDLRAKIEADTILSRFLPRTKVVLLRLTAGNFGTIVPTLRAAAERDLNDLPVRMEVALRGLKPKSPEAKSALTLTSEGVRVVRQIRSGMPPADALRGLAGLAETEVPNVDMRAFAVRLGIVAREYKAGGDSLAIVLRAPPPGLAGCQGLCVRRSYFLAFLVADEVRAGRLGPEVQRWRPRVLALVDRGPVILTNLTDELTALKATIESLKTALAEKKITDPEAFGKVIDAVTTLAASSARLSELVEQNDERVQGALEVITIAGDLWKAQANRQYQQLAIDAIQLLQSFDALEERHARVLSFMSALVAAQSPTEVSAVLRSSAVPVSSYRLKRSGRPGDPCYSLTLNGYLGGIVGTERLVGSQPRKGTFAAPAAPIGVEFSYALRSFSAGVLLSVIDVGTLATALIDESANSNDTELQTGFAQVFAPGAFLVFGISERIPVSVGYGFQRVPKLRKQADGTNVDVKRAQSVFLAVDIPIFRFGS